MSVVNLLVVNLLVVNLLVVNLLDCVRFFWWHIRGLRGYAVLETDLSLSPSVSAVDLLEVGINKQAKNKQKDKTLYLKSTYKNL